MLGASPFGAEAFGGVATGVVSIGGGGGLSAQGVKATTGDPALSGGGQGAELCTKHALASIAIEITEFLLDFSFLGTDTTLGLSGGGQLDVTFTADHTQRSTGTISLSGGGAATATGVKRARQACTVTGGGALTTIGTKHGRTAPVLSGGGTLTATASVRHRQPFAIAGGGSPSVTTRKRALLDPQPAQISGGGALDGAGFKGARGVLVDLAQGGDLTAVAVRRAFTTLQVPGGGTLTVAGRKLASTDIVLHGGGHLWGPYPWALNPGVQLLVGDRVAIVQLPSVDAGSVQILTPECTVELLQPVDTLALLDAELIAQVQLVSVRGLEMTRTGS